MKASICPSILPREELHSQQGRPLIHLPRSSFIWHHLHTYWSEPMKLELTVGLDRYNDPNQNPLQSFGKISEVEFY